MELRLGAERGRSDGACAAGGPRLEERCCQLTSLRACASDLVCAPKGKAVAAAVLTTAGAVEGRGAANALRFDMSSSRMSLSSSVSRFTWLVKRSCDMSRRALISWIDLDLVGVRIGCSMASAVVSAEKCAGMRPEKAVAFSEVRGVKTGVHIVDEVNTKAGVTAARLLVR